jgi:hypothetical protein
MSTKINKYKIKEYFKDDNIVINANDISEIFIYDDKISITIPFDMLSDNLDLDKINQEEINV